MNTNKQNHAQKAQKAHRGMLLIYATVVGTMSLGLFLILTHLHKESSPVIAFPFLGLIASAIALQAAKN